MINHHKCTCGKERKYSFRYDAYFCEACDKWLEPHCQLAGKTSDSSSVHCIYCDERPEKPSQTPTHKVAKMFGVPLK